MQKPSSRIDVEKCHKWKNAFSPHSSWLKGIILPSDTFSALSERSSHRLFIVWGGEREKERDPTFKTFCFTFRLDKATVEVS